MAGEQHHLVVDVSTGQAYDKLLEGDELTLVQDAQAGSLAEAEARERKREAFERLAARASTDELVADLLTVLGWAGP